MSLKRGPRTAEAPLAFEEPVKRLKITESRVVIQTPFPQDADQRFEEESSEEEDEEESKRDQSEDESDEESDEEDDEDQLELMREYEKIKRERAEEQRKRELEKVEELKKKQLEEVLRGNPLLNQDEAQEISEAYSLKRKWYEETIFKNQAKTEPKEKKRFVNDTVRSDFHRKFLTRFIQ